MIASPKDKKNRNEISPRLRRVSAVTCVVVDERCITRVGRCFIQKLRVGQSVMGRGSGIDCSAAVIANRGAVIGNA